MNNERAAIWAPSGLLEASSQPHAEEFNSTSCSKGFDADRRFDARPPRQIRRARRDMAAATLNSYRRVLNGVWRPALEGSLFHQVRDSKLVAIADSQRWSKKTYNNAISILRRAFDFGYRDHPEQHNPAQSLRSARLRKAERPRIDPLCMQDAATLIAALHRDRGEAQGNHDEFRLFTGMRPSEEIALVLSDLDLVNGIVSVNKARVAGIDRCQTTMPRVYAAWAQDTAESDVEAIRASMNAMLGSIRTPDVDHRQSPGLRLKESLAQVQMPTNLTFRSPKRGK
jgi:integrase